MAKRLVAKTGEYQKEGQTKGEYTRIGVLMNNDSGEYLLLDPTVNLAGVLTKQNLLAHASGKKPNGNVMVSVFSDEDRGRSNSQQQSAPQGGYDDSLDVPF